MDFYFVASFRPLAHCQISWMMFDATAVHQCIYNRVLTVVLQSIRIMCRKTLAAANVIEDMSWAVSV